MTLREKLRPYPEKKAGRENSEGSGVREPDEPRESAQKDAGKRACRHDSGERPDHAALPHVTDDAARNGHHIIKLIGGAHGRRRITEKRHLEGQQKKGPGNAAHGTEKRHDESGQRGNEDRNVDTGDGKQHDSPPADAIPLLRALVCHEFNRFRDYMSIPLNNRKKRRTA